MSEIGQTDVCAQCGRPVVYTGGYWAHRDGVWRHSARPKGGKEKSMVIDKFNGFYVEQNGDLFTVGHEGSGVTFGNHPTVEEALKAAIVGQNKLNDYLFKTIWETAEKTKQ